MRIDNKTADKLQWLNEKYNFLIDFEGLAEIQDSYGLTINSIDQLDEIDYILNTQLNADYYEEVSKHIEALKEAIETAQNTILNEVKQLTK